MPASGSEKCVFSASTHLFSPALTFLRAYRLPLVETGVLGRQGVACMSTSAATSAAAQRRISEEKRRQAKQSKRDSACSQRGKKVRLSLAGKGGVGSQAVVAPAPDDDEDEFDEQGDERKDADFSVPTGATTSIKDTAIETVRRHKQNSLLKDRSARTRPERLAQCWIIDPRVSKVHSSCISKFAAVAAVAT